MLKRGDEIGDGHSRVGNAKSDGGMSASLPELLRKSDRPVCRTIFRH
jgi:hypothetical protein